MENAINTLRAQEDETRDRRISWKIMACEVLEVGLKSEKFPEFEDLEILLSFYLYISCTNKHSKPKLQA